MNPNSPTYATPKNAPQTTRDGAEPIPRITVNLVYTKHSKTGENENGI